MSSDANTSSSANSSIEITTPSICGLNASGIVASAASAIANSARSEEHTSELQSLMRISYAVFCLTKTTINTCIVQQINNNTIKIKTVNRYTIIRIRHTANCRDNAISTIEI